MSVLKKRVNTVLSDELEEVLSLLAEGRDAKDAKFLPHDKAWLRDVRSAGSKHLPWILRS